MKFPISIEIQGFTTDGKPILDPENAKKWREAIEWSQPTEVVVNLAINENHGRLNAAG